MLRLVVSTQTNPYWNVAVENHLLSQPSDGAVALYLWKNRRTVVVGQNQNPFAECNVDLLEADGGYLMRRTTGGGAVYHDDGNINFSFVAPYDRYDQMRQFEVIRRAVQAYGIDTVLSGRNDLLAVVPGESAASGGRKFSGNAFSKGKNQRLHHGTILIKGNIADMQRYLKVKPAKLQKHGVKSVQSRVVNLAELADVTSENIVPHLIAAFEEVYGESAQRVAFDQLVQLPEVMSLYRKYSSDEWRYGRWRTFKAQKNAQFDWGCVELSLTVDQKNDCIDDVQLATDALDVGLCDALRLCLVGASLREMPAVPDNENRTMLLDIMSLIY